MSVETVGRTRTDSKNPIIGTHYLLSEGLAAFSAIRDRKDFIRETDGTSPQQRGQLGLSVFQGERDSSKNPIRRKQFDWSVKWMQNWLEGGIRQVCTFLSEQGVFSGNYWLTRPSDVMPQGEFTNLNPKNYGCELASKVETALRYFFGEYKYVEEHVLDMVGIRLLLKNGQNMVLNMAKKLRGHPIIEGAGVGGGSELKPILKQGTSVRVFDHQNSQIVANLLRSTFGSTYPIQEISNGSDIDRQPLRTWSNRGYPATIFVSGGTDLSKKIDGNILRLLTDSGINSKLFYSQYCYHEIPFDERPTFISNGDAVTQGPNIIIDGLPTIQALCVVLGVFNRLEDRGMGLPLDAHGATYTHMICPKPEELIQTVSSAIPTRLWNPKIFSEPPRPLLANLQQAVVGTRR